MDVETGRALEAPLEEFFGDKVIQFDFGNGPQLALPLDHWRDVAEPELLEVGR